MWAAEGPLPTVGPGADFARHMLLPDPIRLDAHSRGGLVWTSDPGMWVKCSTLCLDRDTAEEFSVYFITIDQGWCLLKYDHLCENILWASIFPTTGQLAMNPAV